MGCVLGKFQGSVIQRVEKYAQRSYSTATASRMAYFSKITYSSGQRIKQWNFRGHEQTLKLQQVQLIESKDLNLLVLVGYFANTNQIIVSFRGTEFSSGMNWLIDISCHQVQWLENREATTDATVHKGFHICYMTLKQDLNKKVKQKVLKHKSACIAITGHSLGSAIALLFAVALTSQLQSTEIIVYTYGQPRVGNKVFKKLAQNRIKTYYRIIHDDDVIARVPNLNYYHCGKEVVYTEGMAQYKVCQADSKYAKQVFDDIDLFHDHKPTDYILLKVQSHEGQFSLKAPQDKNIQMNEEEKQQETALAQKRIGEMQKIHQHLMGKILKE